MNAASDLDYTLFFAAELVEASRKYTAPRASHDLETVFAVLEPETRKGAMLKLNEADCLLCEEVPMHHPAVLLVRQAIDAFRDNSPRAAGLISQALDSIPEVAAPLAYTHLSAVWRGMCRPRLVDTEEEMSSKLARRRDLEELVRAQLLAAAPDAVAFLHQVVKDEDANLRCRVDAAKALLDRGGFPAAQQPEDSGGAKSPSEMSQDELRDFLRDTEEELARRAKEVTPAPFGFLD